MQFVICCPGMPFNGRTIQEGRSLGGSETAAYYLARNLANLGHRVLVFSNTEEGGEWDGVDYAPMGPQSQHAPLGEYAMAFVTSTMHDVLIVQRAIGAWRSPPRASVAYMWLHDLALMRQIPMLRADCHFYNGYFGVSEWHKAQIEEVYKLPESRIHVVRNSVDVGMYDSIREHPDFEPRQFTEGRLRLLYQSRPERGLEHLVRPGGIMEQLAQRRPEALLAVCGYDNTTQEMRGYYEMLNKRIEELPNCVNLGSLGKAQLARAQMEADLLVYSSEFEETSCITAMEAQAAGLPMIASNCGAMRETTTHGGVKLFDLKDGLCDEEKFIRFISSVGKGQLIQMRDAQLKKAKELRWEKSAGDVEQIAKEGIAAQQKNTFSMARSMMDLSDFSMASEYIAQYNEYGNLDTEVEEIETHIGDPTEEGWLKERYDSDDAVSEIEKSGGSLDMRGNHRFMEIARTIKDSHSKRILDYGCQKGHYLWSLQELFPDYFESLVGIDVSPRVIDWAKLNATQEGKIEYYAADVLDGMDVLGLANEPDCVLLAEVLEHVSDPVEFMNKFAHAKSGTQFIISTPFGDWEGKNWRNDPEAVRYHLHHFTRQDLIDMFGHNANFITVCVPAGSSDRYPLGSWITSFEYTGSKPIVKELDQRKRVERFVPHQTVSYCGIVHNAEDTILRMLKSILPVVDEFIIAVDYKCNDDTVNIIKRFRDRYVPDRRFEIIEGADSPLDIGFDEARNRTVQHARGDWILWMDADEVLVYPERLVRYVRDNVYDGYSIQQHHMSSDPIGVLTTDLPVRLYRNVPYLKFLGVVHEHPDDVENFNVGPRQPALVQDVVIIHGGYDTELIRRQRFHRNLPLMERDRTENPHRTLGMMLWIRDLSHMVGMEGEQSGRVTESMLARAREGVDLYSEMLDLATDEKHPMAPRLLKDAARYYTICTRVLNIGFELDLKLAVNRDIGQVNADQGEHVTVRFANTDHYERFMKALSGEILKDIEGKYY